MRILLLILCLFLTAHADVEVTDVPHPFKLTAADLAAMPQRTVQGHTGVELSELLKKAGAVSPDEKHSQNVRSYLVVEGADGYRAIFALAEIDPLFTDKSVLLGSDWRLFVPDDKLGARAVRDVVRLSVQHLP